MEKTLNLSMRPQSFDDFIGQPEKVEAIKHQIESGKLPVAWLFCGPFGCGKTTLAYIVARAVQGWEFPADMEPDVREINAANMTGIDDMRALVKQAEFLPMMGKYRVIILDEAHKLSKPAQELLLKEFERTKSPTAWIICTSDPEKLIDGIKAGRTFTVKLDKMDEPSIRSLVARAVEKEKYTGDPTEFIAEVLRARVASPRVIVMAFTMYTAGMPAKDAIAANSFSVTPELFELAFAVAFGDWERDTTLPWAGNKQIVAVGAQLKALDDKLKKKTTGAAKTEEEDVSEEDLASKADIANSLRLLVAAFLKNRVLKGGAKAVPACEALVILAGAVPPSAFGMEWPCTLGALYRVNKKLFAPMNAR